MIKMRFKTIVVCALALTALFGIIFSAQMVVTASAPSLVAQAAPQAVVPHIVYPLYNDIVIDEARGRIYASNNVEKRIDILSLETLQVLSTLDLNSDVRGMDLAPGGNELAVAALDIGEIVFINPNTWAVTGRIKLSTGSYELGNPIEVIYGRPGRLYATGWSPSGGVYVIDTVLKVEIKNYQGFSSGEISLALSADQNTLFVGHSGSDNKIERYDVSTDDIVRDAVTPFNNETYGKICLSQEQFIVTSQGQVWTTDLATRLDNFYNTPHSGSIACSQDTSLVFITYGSYLDGSMLYIFDLDTYQELARRDFGVQLGVISLNADESLMYISSGRGIERLGTAFRERAFLPVTKRTTAGIFGSLTNSHFVDPSNQYVELRHYDGAAWSTVAATTTNFLGEFRFENVPGLQPGQAYVVIFRNTTDNESVVGLWASPVLTSYTYGTKVILNPFDITEAFLNYPSSNTRAEFPVTFSWSLREDSPADAYEVRLYGSGWEPPFYTAPQVTGDHFVLTTLPAGFKPFTGYIWELWIYAPDGGMGISHKYTYFTFGTPPRPDQLPITPQDHTVDLAIEAMLGR